MDAQHVDVAATRDAAWQLIRDQYAALLRSWGMAGQWTLGVRQMPRDAHGRSYEIYLCKEEGK